MTKGKLTIPKRSPNQEIIEYIRAFDRANHLIPVTYNFQGKVVTP